MTIYQAPPSHNGAKLEVSRHNGAPKRPGLGNKRPSQIRMDNREAYRAVTSIFHRKKNETEPGRTVGVRVRYHATTRVLEKS